MPAPAPIVRRSSRPRRLPWHYLALDGSTEDCFFFGIGLVGIGQITCAFIRPRLFVPSHIVMGLRVYDDATRTRQRRIPEAQASCPVVVSRQLILLLRSPWKQCKVIWPLSHLRLTQTHLSCVRRARSTIQQNLKPKRCHCHLRTSCRSPLPVLGHGKHPRRTMVVSVLPSAATRVLPTRQQAARAAVISSPTGSEYVASFLSPLHFRFLILPRLIFCYGHGGFHRKGDLAEACTYNTLFKGGSAHRTVFCPLAQ